MYVLAVGTGVCGAGLALGGGVPGNGDEVGAVASVEGSGGWVAFVGLTTVVLGGGQLIASEELEPPELIASTRSERQVPENTRLRALANKRCSLRSVMTMNPVTGGPSYVQATRTPPEMASTS